MARLIWKRREAAGQAFPIGDSAYLGRDSGVDCVLDAKSVSRRHAKIERKDIDFYITDLGSTNGTLVNGTPVAATTRITPGDLIQLGEEVLEFEEEGAGPLITRGSLVTEPLARDSPSEAGKPGQEPLPRRVGKFYLVKRLGQGGMGTVYRGIDLDSNKEVAVKFIQEKIGRRDAFLDFFHNREAVLAREIEHPNVIRVYEHGVDAHQHFISMEFIPGKNLYHVLKERRLEPTEVVEVVRQVACGLAAAHGQGVVHSDIKPANILLADEGARPAEREEPAAIGANGDQDPESLLEFEDPGAPPGTPQRDLKYEPELMEEIRRRMGDPPAEVLADPPYFQRASEMRFLLHYFERILEGKGYFILVEGEAGIGKDRLISEFLEERKAAAPAAAGSEIQFYDLDCSRIEGIPLLHEQVLNTRSSVKMTLRHTADQVARQLASTRTPTVLRILNLASASPLACDLIERLGELMPQQGILVLAALGPEGIRENDSLKPFLEHMAPHTKELYLRPLTEYQIGRYLQQIFKDALTGLTLSADLHRLSGGNFAKLLDILRGFFDRGILRIDQPSGRLHYRPRAQEFELEEGKTLYEKYRAYGKVEQRVLELAAFIGPRFLFDTLLKLHDLSETSLFFILRTLLADGFYVEENRTWYGFTNAAFQRYMAERTPASERPHLHRKLTRLLQTVTVPESPELYHLRARHLAGCHEYVRAVQSLLEAAHLARNDYRVDMCRDMFQEILRIYRLLARKESVRRDVTAVLRDWFRRDGNWYEILGSAGSNIPPPHVKIADFGISFRMKDDERGYQVEKRPALGTPRYLAPERVKGEYGGFKSDIFALGIITYEMAAGAPPFADLKGSEVMEANRERRIQLPAEVIERYPPGLDALLAGMVHKDPARRWDAERVIREVTKLQLDQRSGQPAKN